ncbi:MAG: hypothetical protein AAF291_14600 [Pseudomonadota bacterium]
MTIRFAAETTSELAAHRLPACTPIARALVTRAMERVSNDNAPAASAYSQSLSEDVLRAALRHFAQHGMAAARIAHARAQAACSAKDRPSFDWWLAITHALDRRLAAEIEPLTPDCA